MDVSTTSTRKDSSKEPEVLEDSSGVGATDVSNFEILSFGFVTIRQ